MFERLKNNRTLKGGDNIADFSTEKVFLKQSGESAEELIVSAIGIPSEEKAIKAIGETTGSFSYHRTKDIIEQERIKYGEGLGDQELPPISFSIEKNTSKIKFNLTDETAIFSIIAELSKTLGEMKTSSFIESLYFSKKDSLEVIISQSYYFTPRSINFSKDKDLDAQEIEAIINIYKLANPLSKNEKLNPKKTLESLGATIFDPDNAPKWDYLAGYEEVKQQIKETIIFSLKHPEVYEQIAQKTRKTFESNRPKAVLFEGPPGTGKTTMARVIAGEVDANLVYVPIESIMTKWYGESGKNLAAIFKACNDLGNSLLFLDEIDSLATTREKDVHEETRRVLSVLLRNIDGFNLSEKTILIGATNRKKDLDPALLSRFDTSIEFSLPNADEREAIFRNYATQLTPSDLTILAEEGKGLSGRDIKNLCERAERSLASELITNKSEVIETPSLDRYLSWIKKI